jgi:hypothetical protein
MPSGIVASRLIGNGSFTVRFKNNGDPRYHATGKPTTPRAAFAV